MSGRAALETHAPEAAAVLARLEASIWPAAESLGLSGLAGPLVTLVAGQHGLEAVGMPQAAAGSSTSEGGQSASLAWGGSAAEDNAEAALRFAEQMSFDVASLGDEFRAPFLAAFGAAAFPLAQIIYVADFAPRIRHALDELFGASDAAPAAQAGSEELGAVFEEWIHVVPQLTALDPVLTELVRLRGAGHHECRLCQSVRYLPALRAGARDELLDGAIRSAAIGSTPAQTAALQFADELLATPGRLSPEVLSAVEAHFAPEAQVELVLDIARNATNKLAVAFAADTPRVESGFEICEADADGTLHYGLPDPRGSGRE